MLDTKCSIQIKRHMGILRLTHENKEDFGGESLSWVHFLMDGQ